MCVNLTLGNSCSVLVYFQSRVKTIEKAEARIAYLESVLQKTRDDLLTEKTNLARTLGIVQQLAKENVKAEDTRMDEKAFITNKIDDQLLKASLTLYSNIYFVLTKYILR